MRRLARSPWRFCGVSRGIRLLVLPFVLLAVIFVLLTGGSASAWDDGVAQLVRVEYGSTVNCHFYDPAVGEAQIFSIESLIDATGEANDESRLNWTCGGASLACNWSWSLHQYDMSLAENRLLSVGSGGTAAGTLGWCWKEARLNLTVNRPAVLDFQYLLDNPIMTDAAHLCLTAGFWNTDSSFTGGTRLLDVNPMNWTVGSTTGRSFSMVPGRYYRFYLVTDSGIYGDGTAPGTHALDLSALIHEGTAPTVEAGPGASATEGTAFTGSGSFTDPDPDTWTATVNYGDGSGDQALTLNSDKTFALSHAYADNGAYTVTVTVNEDGGYSGSDTRTVTVGNADPAIGTLTGLPAQIVPGATVNLSAVFSDPGTLDTHTATWNWGDGTTSSGSVSEANGAGTVTGSHAYAAAGRYTVTLTVTDDDGGTATATYSANTVTPATLVTSLSDRIRKSDLMGAVSGFTRTTVLSKLDYAGSALRAGLAGTALKTITDLQAYVQKQTTGLSVDGKAKILAALADIATAIRTQYRLP